LAENIAAKALPGIDPRIVPRWAIKIYPEITDGYPIGGSSRNRGQEWGGARFSWKMKKIL
jgi:hypothetical protein